MSNFRTHYSSRGERPKHISEKFEALMNRLPANLDGDAEFEALLSDIQGNIICHHRKNFSRLYFIHFKKNENKEHLKNALAWIKKVANHHLTSANSQFEDEDEDGAELAERGAKMVKEGTKLREGTKLVMRGIEMVEEGSELVEVAKLAEEATRLVEKSAKLVEEGNKLVEKGAKLKEAETQLAEKRNPDIEKSSKPVCCFYLTWEGYRTLGLTHLAPPPLKGRTAFTEGMKNRAAFPFPTVKVKKDEGGKEVESDEAYFDERLYPKDETGVLDIHAMLMIASDDPDFGNVDSELKLTDLKPDWGIIAEQSGLMKRRNFIQEKPDDKKVVEWFGFRDGISQPLFFPDKAGIKYFDGDSLAPLKIVLTKDKGGQHWYSAGSFLAFLKLEQDVAQFNRNVHTIADKILEKVSKESSSAVMRKDPELAAAYLMGRFYDGTSVCLSKKAENWKDKFPENDFYYSKVHKTIGDSNISDEKGIRCPFAAHARKANPRDDAEVRAIVRRGIVYDDRYEKLSEDNIDWKEDDTPIENVGLLFMSFQSSIEEQFEHILNKWLLSVNVGKQATGVDMLTGTKNDREFSVWYLPTKWGDENPDNKTLFTSNEIKPCIHFKGGEYFFAPSISFLKNIESSSMIPDLPNGGFKIPKIIRKYD